MALGAVLATTSIFRSVPFVASMVVHAGVAATLVVSAGHASTGRSTSVALTSETLEVEVVPEAIDPAPEPEPEKETPPTQNVASPMPPTHTHPFPVDPSHDAKPHDPSQPHEHADRHADEAPPAAAPAATTEAPLPRFTIPSGSAASSPGGPTGSTSTNASPSRNAGAAAVDDAIVPAASVQVAAKLVQSATAAYPPDARTDDVEGDVQLDIVVDREGRVVDARVTRPAGHGFDEAALQAIRRYRFSPAMREGGAVRVRMPWSVQFRLR